MASRAARTKHYHGGAKGNVVGNNVKPAPAWRESVINDPGSKILLSNLPVDVSETEITDLMKKVIGPVVLNKSFLFHNSKGYPLGMALVAFRKSGDAVIAREKFNGKVIDGKRAIKLELITDQDFSKPTVLSQPKPKSLFERLGAPDPTPNKPAKPAAIVRNQTVPVRQQHQQQQQQQRILIPANGGKPVLLTKKPTIPNKKRQKKGPKRVKKKAVTAADLDKDMDDYISGRTPV